ncbi:MAG: contractile injection system tape measure protein, partial [Planctomycetota bacterium]
RLGLLRERRFRDEAAAHRAAGLLQHVAGTEGTPPEFLVPLNKVLCGIAPEEVFDFGDDITDAEAEECEDLLCAVIQQAPILRNMSTAGFRGSFLLRKGQLATRDGHWLLRVERETHDVVLERFPWGFSVVKLPWMAALLQVEW